MQYSTGGGSRSIKVGLLVIAVGRVVEEVEILCSPPVLL